MVNTVVRTLTVGLLMAERDGGSARRRRERRLRSFLRHERMTVRMELAAALHHSSFRGAGPVAHHAPRSQKTVNCREGAVYFELFDEDTAGLRPTGLVEPRGPLEGVLQRIVEQIVDPVPLVPMLHDVMPQMVEQLVDLLAPLDFPVAEQVIEVPKVSSPTRCPRTVLSVPQTAEQLVEVPTVLSVAFLQQRTAEQIVGFPVPGHEGGDRGGLQGLSQGQGSTAVCGAEHVGTPVPRGGDFHCLSQGQGSSSFCGADHVGIPVPLGRVGNRGLQGFTRGQSSAVSTGEQTIGAARGGLHFGTVLVASGDMRPGVIKTDDGQRFRFQSPSWFRIPVGRRVAFRAEEGDGVTAAFHVYCWDG